MPDGVTARLPTTTGKGFPRDQSSGGLGHHPGQEITQVFIIPLNEPWSFGAPKASKQQVEIKLIHGERKVQAQHSAQHAD